MLEGTTTARPGKASSPRLLRRLLSLLCCAGLLALAMPAYAAETLLDDFEDVSDWNGLTSETTLVQQGSGAGRWADTVDQTSIRKEFSPPLDLSGHSHMGFWLYSAEATGAQLQLVLDSEDPNSDGADYYSTELTIDWQGWRWMWLSKEELGAARAPVGWHEINSVSFSASGWGHTPVAGTDLVLDQMVFSDAVVTNIARDQDWSGADFVYTFDLELTEPDNVALAVDVFCDVPAELSVAIDHPQVNLAPGAVEHAVVTVTVPATVIAQGPYLVHESTLGVTFGAAGREQWIEGLANPPAARAAPRMLLTADDFSRIDQWSATHAWAANRRQRIIDRADGWPTSFLDKYGLGAVALPPEGGQWGMHYVCPDHGVNLVYEPPMTHRCPIDDQTYTGWPYDQVIYARQHGDLAGAALDAGLAFQLTGQSSYAATAAQLLVDYAAAYASYPIHGVDGGDSGSGARILSQTLDESGWLIEMAWAYDLVSASGALSPAEQSLVEQQLLRASAATIRRHDAGLSNWQAWHNAAIAAAGRAVDDPRLVAHAVHGPSGFDRHMAESVLSDGFWYESSWGYHFYTLSPMTYLAEMGERGEFDLYSNAALQSMYVAPILFAPPDLVLPAFNDSGAVDLRGSAGWRLDAAFRAYDDQRLVLPLLGESRDEEALFWGAESLPVEAPIVTESLIFDASGYAVLRGGSSEDPWYLALDYGPHGGWHGHFDKLGYVFYARGEMFGIDPGSHSYALPLHDTWDRSTVAHNTVVVDEIDQQEATGVLERFHPLPGCTWARASVADAYEAASLARDLVMVDGYLLDRMTGRSDDGASHQYDWFYHNPGALSHDRSVASYGDLPGEGGYQHLTNNQAEAIGDDGRFVFSFEADATYEGGLWASEDGVVAESTYTDEQAHDGDWSGRLHYDFSGAPGAYVTFRTRSMAEYTEEAPTRLSLWVYGDGSGNSFRIRIVDSSGESHLTEEASLSFDGWQQIDHAVDGSLSFWGGDENGVIDLPLQNLVFQLNHVDGAPAVGDLHLDDWQLTFPTAGEITVEDYERLVAQELVWVKGAADTTYVVGEGIGPDLLVPVPYLMVRRGGETAGFDVLHVPHGTAGPLVDQFERLDGDASASDEAAGYRIGGTHETSGERYEDVLIIVGAGASGTERSFGDHRTNAVLAWTRRQADGRLERLALAEGSHVADAVRELYVAPAALSSVSFAIEGDVVEILAVDGEIANSRLLAPATTRVVYQGGDVPFVQDGDYVLFGSLDGTPPGAGPGDDSGCGCTVPGRGTSWTWLALACLPWLRRRRRGAGAAPIAKREEPR